MSRQGHLIMGTVMFAALQLFPAAQAAAGVRLVMSSETVWDPVRAAQDPLTIPGARVAVRIDIENNGAESLDDGSLTISVPVPPGAALLVGGGGERFELEPGHGLSLEYRTAADAGDDVEFSDDGGANFTYAPSPAADGADPAVTHVRFRCGGSLAGGGRARLGFNLTLAGPAAAGIGQNGASNELLR